MNPNTALPRKSRFEEIELSVCLICIHLLANGEYNDGEDTAERCAEGIARLWKDNARHLVPGGQELGFCTTACEGCGDTNHGDRYHAVALIPKPA